MVPRYGGGLLVSPLAAFTDPVFVHVFGSPPGELTEWTVSEYQEFLSDEINRLRFATHTGRMTELSLGITTPADLNNVLETVRTSWALTRPSLREKLRAQLSHAEEDVLNRVIDLGIRILYMINVQEQQFQNLTPQTPVLPWDDTVPLQSFIEGHFPSTAADLKPREGRLHPYFTAANLHRICHLNIEWTDSLEDHLRLDRRANVLRIFPYKRCLLQILDASRNGHASAIPPRILMETVQSLDLLFPHWDERTEQLLRKHRKTFHHVGHATSPRLLNLREFSHWGERLLELYEEVFLSPPASWAQLWSDRRSPQQWLTFWLALVIAILTLISTVATIVQTWAALR